MQSPYTPRFGLPMLAIGQSQKELFHNEALTALDFLLHPVAQSIVSDPAALTPEEGESWIVGSSPLAGWSDRANQIASWTSGGWRFVAPTDFLRIYLLGSQEIAIFQNDSWNLFGSIAAPVGGTIVDIEARHAIDLILDALKSKAIIAD